MLFLPYIRFQGTTRVAFKSTSKFVGMYALALLAMSSTISRCSLWNVLVIMLRLSSVEMCGKSTRDCTMSQMACSGKYLASSGSRSSRKWPKCGSETAVNESCELTVRARKTPKWSTSRFNSRKWTDRTQWKRVVISSTDPTLPVKDKILSDSSDERNIVEFFQENVSGREAIRCSW